MTREEMQDLARRIRMDTTAIQTKLTTLMEAIAALPPDEDHDRRCPICQVTTRGPLSLAEHIYASHNGPLPAHYAKAEALAGLDTAAP